MKLVLKALNYILAQQVVVISYSECYHVIVALNISWLLHKATKEKG